MKHLQKLQSEKAISFVKETFEKELSKKLHLHKISSPIAVLDGTGINDDLNGIERPVSFPIKHLGEQKAVVVHSLAKWKRLRLYEFDIPQDEGIITDMRALRPDEDETHLHSIYVDQWDWEKHIDSSDRNISYLKETVKLIYEVMKETEKSVSDKYQISKILPDEITFIHTETLREMFPKLTPKQREDKIVAEHKAVFLIGIGGALSDGSIHDGRAPDYDDWSSFSSQGLPGLNGDILVWHPELQRSFEISSMGIRVDAKALKKQLKIRKAEERESLSYHQLLLAEKLPQSIGGGIGQSRLVMFMLKKRHIGEVQVGIWKEKTRKSLLDDGIVLL